MTIIGPVVGGPEGTDAYEAPNGVESVLPGMPDDAGSRDPSAATIGGAVANAMAQMQEMHADAVQPMGSGMGDPIALPPLSY